jgi:hypothetical protein
MGVLKNGSPGVEDADEEPAVVPVREGVGVAAVAEQIEEALERDGTRG